MTKEYNLSLSNFVDIMGVSRNTVNIWVRNGVYKNGDRFLAATSCSIPPI